MITMLNVPKLGSVLVAITAVIAAVVVMLATAGARVHQSLLEVLRELGITFNAFPSDLFNFIIILYDFENVRSLFLEILLIKKKK